MALMAGTVRRHSSALEGKVSRTPRAAIWDSSSALKVSQTPGAAWHSSDDWNCEETQFSPEGRGIPDTSSCCLGQQFCPEGVLDTWKLSDFLGKSDLKLLQQEGYRDCSGKSGLARAARSSVGKGVLTVRESQDVPGMMGYGFPAGYGDSAPLLKTCYH
ncbi:hypothetical protein STEG23_030858 [Scotinomys teguina]